jgi:hypothetical protein
MKGHVGDIMGTFLNNVVTPHAALLLVAWIACLVGFAYPGFQARQTGGVFAGFAWFLWLLAGIVCLVAWIKVVFGV